LRRDQLARIGAEFEGVLSLRPVHIVHNLIGVDDRELRGIVVRPEVKLQIFIDTDVGK